MFHCKSLAGAACALSLLACSCSHTGNDAGLAFNSYSAAGVFTLQGSAEVFQQDSDLVYADSVSLVLPVRLEKCNVSALQDTILYYALGVKNRPVVGAMNQWIDDNAARQGFKPVRDQHARDAQVAQGFDFVSGYITMLSPELMVYCVRTDTYEAGAAHGMTTRRYINFSLVGDGEVVTLSRLFTPAGLKALPRRIAQQAASMSASIGRTQVSALPENGNFYISAEDEIVFSYQPYEIASFAQGQINIPFYPYELVDYMTPGAIAFFHLEDLNE